MRVSIVQNDSIEYVNSAFCQYVNKMSESVLKSFLKAIVAYDLDTARHNEDVAKLMLDFANYLELSQAEVSLSYFSGLVHDIGKIAIPHSILHKPSRLTDKEFDCIREHPATGGDILEGISGFERIANVVRYHHERYDGHGYPYGLNGTEIPLLSRILAICDSFAAMTTERCYRRTFTTYEAIKEIEVNQGTQFDADLSRHFVIFLRGSKYVNKGLKMVNA